MMGIKARVFAPVRRSRWRSWCRRPLLPAPGAGPRPGLRAGAGGALLRRRRGGRASIPVVFFKLQLVMFFEGIRSERQLMRLVADRLSVRWYIGYDLGEALPDHSSLTRIRERYGLEVFRRFFDAIVERCLAAGLVWGEEPTSTPPRWWPTPRWTRCQPRFAVAARAHLDDLFAPTEEATRPASPQRSRPAQPPRIGPRERAGADDWPRRTRRGTTGWPEGGRQHRDATCRDYRAHRRLRR